MSNDKERRTSKNSGSEEQTGNGSQKKSAPEYPSATETSKRKQIRNDSSDFIIETED